MYPAYLRGEALLGTRQWDAAIAEYQRILAHRGLVWNFPLAALANLQLGRAGAGKRDTANARKAYDDFLTLWRQADDDIPVFRLAKADSTRLK